MTTPPVFLSLDGLDGSGKSTQCRLLADWLRTRGLAVETFVDPGTTEIGKALRAIVLDQRRSMSLPCEMFLFMASRAQLVEEQIRPGLAAGKTVICDRFLLANVVYQGHAGGLPVDKLWEIGQLATGGLEPDLSIVLDLSTELAQSRRVRPADRMEGRGHDFHERVRAGFLAEARRRPERIRVVDASAPTEVVHQNIVNEVERVLAARAGS